MTQRFVPESRATRARRLDPLGQVLVAVLLASATAAIIEGPRRGWGSGLIIALFAVAAASTAALVAAETRRPEPLIDMRFFRSAPFSGAMLIAASASATLSGFLFLNTLYLQTIRGDSAMGAGVRTIPMAAALAVFATVSGRLVAQKGPRPPLVLAGSLLAIGALMFLRLDAHTPLWCLTVAYVVFGAGSGLVTGPITHTAVSGMPADQAGVAGALVSISRQSGAAIGVAVTGSIIAAGAGAGFMTAAHAAWAVIAGCGVAVLVAGLASTSRWAMETARRNGDRLTKPRPEGVRHADAETPGG